VKLVAHLEERYGVVVEAHEMTADYLDTVDSIAQLVQSKK
jgi:acyl carrier protein